MRTDERGWITRRCTSRFPNHAPRLFDDWSLRSSATGRFSTRPRRVEPAASAVDAKLSAAHQAIISSRDNTADPRGFADEYSTCGILPAKSVRRINLSVAIWRRRWLRTFFEIGASFLRNSLSRTGAFRRCGRMGAFQFPSGRVSAIWKSCLCCCPTPRPIAAETMP